MSDLYDIGSVEIRIKRDRKRYFYHQILIWIVLIALEVFFSCSMFKLSISHHLIPGYWWVSSIVVLIILLYMSVFLLPGQGDLILTPDGLSIHYFYKLWPEYRWGEFLGFYELHQSSGKNKVFKIAGELKQSVYLDKRILFPRFYEIPLEGLVIVLNQWKDKYGSNPSNIEFSLESRTRENIFLRYFDNVSTGIGGEEAVLIIIFNVMMGLFSLIEDLIH